MEVNPKSVYFYYCGQETKIKVFDGTAENNIIKTISRYLNINTASNDIFFQDAEGQKLIIPNPIPNGLYIFLSVKPKKEILPIQTTQVPTPNFSDSDSINFSDSDSIDEKFVLDLNKADDNIKPDSIDEGTI